MNLSKAILTVSGVFALNLSIPVIAEEIDRELLCRKFPLNSRCRDYRAAEPELKVYQLDRNSFCHRFPFNSQCQQPAVEVIELNLDRSGDNDEWIRIEKQANEVKLLHTTRVKNKVVSGILNGALGLVPVPLPFVKANNYDWEDHQAIQVSFKSDRCKTDDCTITGIDTLILPEGTDIYAGLFSIDYLEKDLERSISFRIPERAKVKAIETITVETR